jgi:excisionase family DNA binding protein
LEKDVLCRDEILTLPEVAQLLKVGEKTVYTMAQRSQLPAFKVAGSGGSNASTSTAESSSRKRPLVMKGGSDVAASLRGRKTRSVEDAHVR